MVYPVFGPGLLSRLSSVICLCIGALFLSDSGAEILGRKRGKKKMDVAIFNSTSSKVEIKSEQMDRRVNRPYLNELENLEILNGLDGRGDEVGDLSSPGPLRLRAGIERRLGILFLQPVEYRDAVHEVQALFLHDLPFFLIGQS